MTELELQGFFSREKCFWCEGPMFDPVKLPPDLHYRFRMRIKTRDHLVPLKDGGAGYTVPACYLCNHAKGSQDPMVFRDKFRPHIPVEIVLEHLIAAKRAAAALPLAPSFKKSVTRHRRKVR